MTDRATRKQIRYILALNQQLGGEPARYANQLAVELPMRLRTIDLHTATRRQASEIIQRLLEAQRSDGTAAGRSSQPQSPPIPHLPTFTHRYRRSQRDSDSQPSDP